jgi:hypothetical protein
VKHRKNSLEQFMLGWIEYGSFVEFKISWGFEIKSPNLDVKNAYDMFYERNTFVIRFFSEFEIRFFSFLFLSQIFSFRFVSWSLIFFSFRFVSYLLIFIFVSEIFPFFLFVSFFKSWFFCKYFPKYPPNRNLWGFFLAKNCFLIFRFTSKFCEIFRTQ